MAANPQELAIDADFVTELFLKLLSPILLSPSLYTTLYFLKSVLL